MKSKHLIAIAVVALTGWLATSLNNDVQAKYEQDVADYQAVLIGDTLPLQARVERARPRLEEIQLAKAVQNFRNTQTETVTAVQEAIRPESKSSFVDKLLSTAYQYIGVRYRRGQSSPSGFDCSGFTSFVFKQQNINLTRSSRSQFTEGEPVASVTELRKGDLVFFGGSGGGRNVGHVGIVTEVDPNAGSFKFIHASTSSGIKVDDSKQAYYSRRYIGARRIVQ